MAIDSTEIAVYLHIILETQIKQKKVYHALVKCRDFHSSDCRGHA